MVKVRQPVRVLRQVTGGKSAELSSVTSMGGFFNPSHVGDVFQGLLQICWFTSYAVSRSAA